MSQQVSSRCLLPSMYPRHARVFGYGATLSCEPSIDQGSASYHPGCVQRVLEVPDGFACADCGLSITTLWDWETLFNTRGDDLYAPCPACGRPDLIAGWFGQGAAYTRQADCSGCGLPMLLWHKRSMASYHDFCFAVERALVKSHNRSVESKKTQGEMLREKSRQGCLSLLQILPKDI